MRVSLLMGALPLTLATMIVSPTQSKAAPHYAFATSLWGPGDMHAWSDVSSTNLQGLAAADYTCQARAADAGLDNAENYVAWLSDRNNDAYCRVFGLVGKKSDLCGEMALPTGAGPWIRTGGTPFAGAIEKALNEGIVYSPLNVDEFGRPFYMYAQSFTATAEDGTFNVEFDPDGDCDEWTSSVQDPFGAFPTLGSNLATAGTWTFDGTGVSCDGTRRLMCLQRKAGTSLSGHSHFGKREAFISEVVVTGDLGGLDGADALCKASALAAGLYGPDTFKALLASASANVHVADRIAHDGPWIRRDGLLFAHDKAELINGAVTLPLNVTENGNYVGASVALTGALDGGWPHQDFDCNGWNSTLGMVSGSVANMVAFAPSGGHEWLNIANVGCQSSGSDDWPLRIYCLSDADVLFHDGFEQYVNDL